VTTKSTAIDELPDGLLPPRFSLAVVASPSDIDELGHVSNITYLRWVQDVAKAHSNAVGWNYPRYRELGAVFVVRRHELDYLAPAMDGDALTLTTHIASWSGASCIRLSEIVRSVDGRALAKASTQWALVSLGVNGSSPRPRRIPPELREAFARVVTESVTT